jgi:hypothetical protein
VTSTGGEVTRLAMVEQAYAPAGFRPVLADRKLRLSDPGLSNLMDLLAGTA